jgi:hypothetical protein
MRNALIVAIALMGFSRVSSAADDARRLIYHDVRVDPSGRIAPWFGSGPPQAYDHVIRLVWNFWRNMRQCPNGVPYYLQHQVWKPDEDDSRGLGGDQISMALSSWNMLFDYMGDSAIRDNMIMMADYWLDHGMSRSTDLWADLPFPYNTELHSGLYDGDMRAGKGYLQPDKAGSFGAELVMLYKKTGNRRYLDAAARMADSLVKHIKSGDGENSPWPYRVHAVTGEVHKSAGGDHKMFAAAYTTNWTGTLRLLSGLMELDPGKAASYGRARTIVVEWQKRYPLKTNKWGPFFEDIPTHDWTDTEINADTLAIYILENPEWDARWREQAKSALEWSYNTLANHEFEKWGVIAINEQTAYKVPGNSHTSRHASAELLYCEKTADCATKDAAIRRLNWATYMVDDDGKNRYPRDENWLTDGYGDYVRHYLRAMAAAPELAPDDQNHLLRTSSVLRSIAYASDKIIYTKFNATSVERLKMGAWAPHSISGGAMEWDAKTRALTVRSNAKSVSITR